MTGEREDLERIAAALERLAPPVSKPTDWLSHPAYIWNGQSAHPIDRFDPLPLDRLRGIDEQKTAINRNLENLAAGYAAHDMLLWGARGMGKSALVRASTNAVQGEAPESLALVQIMPGSWPTITRLIETLANEPRAFLLFVDDLGFGSGETQANLALRSVLDGGLVQRPGSIRLGVTSNRRAIVTRNSDENESLHERDERDNALALADRFGLTLGFHPCDRDTYLEILLSYTDPLGLEVDEEEALAWAISRGSRSGRTAYQFASELAGRAKRSL